ncbi:MAG: hypothetical protein BWY09_02923 [Candidatus Hydrogenedentes bacterium ADurb.Bin179]|nr:MAG: hypothetical protein BWY09_02923 [Candidatus Hydrogenedentes bacterium ADurb.Bin179]
MYCGSQERLLAHVGQTEHAGSSETVVLLGLRKRRLNSFLSQLVEASAPGGFGKSVSLIQIILPDMALNHPACGFLRETLLAPWAVCAGFRIAVILPVTFAVGSLVCQQVFLRADVGVAFGIVGETVLSKVLALVGVTPVSHDPLDSLACQLAGYYGIVVSGI